MTKRRTIGENPLDLLIPARPSPVQEAPAEAVPSALPEPKASTSPMTSPAEARPAPPPVEVQADEAGSPAAIENGAAAIPGDIQPMETGPVPSNAVVETSSENAAEEADASSSFLTFEVGGEEYGVPVLRVREIADYVSTTRVPRTPAYVRGVMNLRGNVVPVLDLRVKLGLSPTETTKRSSIVFVDRDASGASLVGLLVESVDRVIAMRPEDIGPTPTLGSSVRVDYLNGIGRAGDTLVLLLAIDVILGSVESQPSAGGLGA